MPSPPSVVLLHGVQSSHATWWRLAQDLTDLGWSVHPLDMLGHGGRVWTGPAPLTLTALADDVLAQAPGPVELLVGHSLGAVVALRVLERQPDYAAAVVVEDPPGPVGRKELGQVAEEVERSVRRARTDRVGEAASVLRDNPSWALLDAKHAVDGGLDTDLAHATGLLRGEPWDLQELVRGCPVPLHLLAATRDSALKEPDRTVVRGLLPPERTSVVASGHCVHRDRPGLWLHEVLAFVQTIAESE